MSCFRSKTDLSFRTSAGPYAFWDMDWRTGWSKHVHIAETSDCCRVNEMIRLMCLMYYLIIACSFSSHKKKMFVAVEADGDWAASIQRDSQEKAGDRYEDHRAGPWTKSASTSICVSHGRQPKHLSMFARKNLPLKATNKVCVKLLNTQRLSNGNLRGILAIAICPKGVISASCTAARAQRKSSIWHVPCVHVYPGDVSFLQPSCLDLYDLSFYADQ